MLFRGRLMIRDGRTVLWKEWKDIPRQHGDWRMHLAAGLGVAMYVGWAYPDLFRSTLGAVLSMGTVGAVMAFYLAPDSFAGERERRTLETLLSSPLSDGGILLGKVLAISLLAWALLLALMVGFVVSIGVVQGWRNLQPSSVGAAILLSLPITSLVSTLGALVSFRAQTVANAQQRLALVVLLVSVVPTGIGIWLLASDLLPGWMLGALRSTVEHAITASETEVVFVAFVALALLNGSLLILGLVRFRRDRAIRL